MSTTIKHTSLLREAIKQIILKEVSNWSCNKNSLGWITDAGVFVDLSEEEMEHNEYIKSITEFSEDEFIMIHNVPIPNGWIKVSNAREFQVYGIQWENISNSQVQAMINIWLQCKKYCKWMNNLEEEEILLWSENRNSRYTIPDFLDEFAHREQSEYFYEKLL